MKNTNGEEPLVLRVPLGLGGDPRSGKSFMTNTQENEDGIKKGSENLKTVNEEPMIFELKQSADGEMGLWLDGKKLRYVGDFNLRSSAAESTAELEIKLMVRLWSNQEDERRENETDKIDKTIESLCELVQKRIKDAPTRDETIAQLVLSLAELISARDPRIT